MFLRFNNKFLGRGKSADFPFRISIHQGRDIPLLEILGNIKLKGGSKTTIVLNPVVIESTDEVKSLTKEQRKCGISTDSYSDNLFFQVKICSTC